MSVVCEWKNFHCTIKTTCHLLSLLRLLLSAFDSNNGLEENWTELDYKRKDSVQVVNCNTQYSRDILLIEVNRFIHNE